MMSIDNSGNVSWIRFSIRRDLVSAPCNNAAPALKLNNSKPGNQFPLENGESVKTMP